jgi:hypothetical protein
MLRCAASNHWVRCPQAFNKKQGKKILTASPLCPVQCATQPIADPLALGRFAAERQPAAVKQYEQNDTATSACPEELPFRLCLGMLTSTHQHVLELHLLA